LGESRYELLCDQAERLELLREERKTLTEELELERRERLQAQRRVDRLTREHPHLELEREGRLHNHRERQRLAEELEEERLARSGDRREVERLRLQVRQLVEEMEVVWERRGSSKGSKSLWGRLSSAKKRSR
jgi:hypothetical protein